MKRRKLILNTINCKYSGRSHQIIDISKYSKYPIDNIRNVNFPSLEFYIQKYNYNCYSQTLELLGIPLNNHDMEIIYYSKAQDIIENRNIKINSLLNEYGKTIG